MKCKNCEANMIHIASKVVGACAAHKQDHYHCEHCGTLMSMTTQNKEEIWTIPKSIINGISDVQIHLTLPGETAKYHISRQMELMMCLAQLFFIYEDLEEVEMKGVFDWLTITYDGGMGL